MSDYHHEDSRLGVHLAYLTGHFRRDNLGRIVIDQCISDEEHLKNGITYEGDDRARCRIVLDDLFERLVGKTGRLFIENAEFDEAPAGSWRDNKTLSWMR